MIHARTSTILALALALFTVAVAETSESAPVAPVAAAEPAPAAAAAPADPRAEVDAALELLAAGDAAAACERLERAREASPDSAIVAYDLGCAQLAAGNLASAEDAFARAASLHEPSLALDVARNRALVSARRAEEIGGEKPEDLRGEDREELIGLVARAVSHLRTILQAQPGDDDARHDMAVLKSWLISLRDAWRLADEARAQEEQEEQPEQPPSSLEILEQLKAAQEPIAAAIPEVEGKDALVALAVREREEVAPKVDEFREAFLREIAQAEEQAAGAAGAQGQPPGGNEELEQVKQSVGQAADTIASFAEQAAADLDAERAADASQKIEVVLQITDQLWRALAPFPAVLGRAVEEEQAIVDAGDQAVAADQTATREITELMVEKAQAMIASAPAPDPATASTAPPTPGQPPAEDPMREALDKAVDLGPQAVEQQNVAVEMMDLAKWPAAIDASTRALELLKEIASALPQDEQGQPQQGDSDEQQEGDQAQEQPPEGDQDQQPEGEQDQQNSEDEREQQPQGELTPEQVQALLQQIREREAERREEERRLRALGRVPVEKDW